MSQKEQCDERVAAAKLEVETKMKKLSASPEESSLVKSHLFIRMDWIRDDFMQISILLMQVLGCLFWKTATIFIYINSFEGNLKYYWCMFLPQLKKTLDKVDKVNEVVSEEVKAPKDLNQTIKSRIKKNKALELLTNDIIVDEGKEYEHLLDLCSWTVTHENIKLYYKYLYIFLFGLCPNLMDECLVGYFFRENFFQRRTTFWPSSCCRQAGCLAAAARWRCHRRWARGKKRRNFKKQSS